MDNVTRDDFWFVGEENDYKRDIWGNIIDDDEVDED